MTFERSALDSVEGRIQEYVQTQFDVSPTDPEFDRNVDLFERGYIDSVGVVELLEFLWAEFSVEVPDDELLGEDFSTIAGIARIVLRNSRIEMRTQGSA